jgi:hypothetical protein
MKITNECVDVCCKHITDVGLHLPPWCCILLSELHSFIHLLDQFYLALRTIFNLNNLARNLIPIF